MNTTRKPVKAILQTAPLFATVFALNGLPRRRWQSELWLFDSLTSSDGRMLRLDKQLLTDAGLSLSRGVLMGTTQGRLVVQCESRVDNKEHRKGLVRGPDSEVWVPVALMRPAAGTKRFTVTISPGTLVVTPVVEPGRRSTQTRKSPRPLTTAARAAAASAAPIKPAALKQTPKIKSIKPGMTPSAGSKAAVGAKAGPIMRVYQLRAGACRLVAEGRWLAEMGFAHGSRFRVELHPSAPRQLLAVLDENGPHKVGETNNKGNYPRLAVPKWNLGALMINEGEEPRVALRPYAGGRILIQRLDD